MKALLCFMLALVLAGCIPIGIRGSTQLAGTARATSAAATSARP